MSFAEPLTAAPSETPGLDRVVDLSRYPIVDPSVPGRAALVASCRAQLQQTGCVVLPGFVRPDALAALEAETDRLAPSAHYNKTRTNPYNCDADDSLPPDHPVNRFAERTNGFVAGDRIGDGSGIRAIYEAAAFQRFVADAMEEPVLHEYADPLAGLVVNVLKPGCQHPWHYDSNDFIVTLMTKTPEAGGSFEFCPNIRRPGDENIAAVTRVLDGDREPVTAFDLVPGDLQIFYGRNALHRVTRVTGSRERHTVIFGYAREPGFVGRAARTAKLFGRIAPIHQAQERDRLHRSDSLRD